MCIFILVVYVEYWFLAPLPLSAARTDLATMQKTLKLSTGKDMYRVAALKLSKHFWYNSEELMGVPLSDDGVSIDEKRRMVEALENRIGGWQRQVRLNVVDPQVLNESTLRDFINQNIRAFFAITGLPTDFLSKDPQESPACQDYVQSQNKLKTMHVVNDVAERGVALIEKYNKRHTRNEEQLQYLLLVVTEHRRRIANANKSTLLQQFQ